MIWSVHGGVGRFCAVLTLTRCPNILARTERSLTRDHCSARHLATACSSRSTARCAGPCGDLPKVRAGTPPSRQAACQAYADFPDTRNCAPPPAAAAPARTSPRPRSAVPHASPAPQRSDRRHPYFMTMT